MMERSRPAHFFLGANSKCGFYSLYDGFTDPAAGDFLWIIKGGPGCGKSTFMKRIGAAAEAAGQPVEYIHCSGDPDSLDAVFLPARRVAYVDGTAPHVIEPRYPGASELYLDLGCFLDAGALETHLPEIRALNQSYRAQYAEAYAQLAAAAALLPKNRAELWGAAELEKLDKKLNGLAARELRRQDKTGRVTHRFLSAWSCKGRVTLEQTLSALCSRVFLLDNALGLGHVYLTRLAGLAAERGYDVLLCHDPLEPEKPEALLLPERGIAFFAAEKPSDGLRPYRHLRLDALAEAAMPAELRALLRRRRRESGVLLRAATETLAAAKTLHDALELIYRPHVDFEGLELLAKDHISWLLEE